MNLGKRHKEEDFLSLCHAPALSRPMPSLNNKKSPSNSTLTRSVVLYQVTLLHRNTNEKLTPCQCNVGTMFRN